jgi:isoleucyl-tRNA synthetase
MNAKLKVRQPLAKVEVILTAARHQDWLEAHDALVRDELNVKQVEYTTEAEEYITYQVQPDFKRLGPRVGKHMPAVKQALQEADAGQLLKQMEQTGTVTLKLDDSNVQLTKEDLQIRLQAKKGWAAAQGRLCVVVLATELTPELIREGTARDLTRLINDHRKEIGCQYTDRIVVGIVTEADELKLAIEENKKYIQTETLAVEIRLKAIDGTLPTDIEVSGHKTQLYVLVVNDN